jgi:DNA invertase Pin-like site-specific DNA recombinase
MDSGGIVFECLVIRERTMAELAAAKRLGKRAGRPLALKPEDIIVANAAE